MSESAETMFKDLCFLPTCQTSSLTILLKIGDRFDLLKNIAEFTSVILLSGVVIPIADLAVLCRGVWDMCRGGRLRRRCRPVLVVEPAVLPGEQGAQAECERGVEEHESRTNGLALDVTRCLGGGEESGSEEGATLADEVE